MMGNKLKVILILLFVANLFAACATFPKSEITPQQSNLTVGMIKTKIIKGQTTQEEILKLFGAPNIITKNKNDDEVWNYNRMSFKYVSGSDGFTAIFADGNRAMSTATTESFDLIITFDKDGKVKDYSVISAKF
jgi:outer membrane protein assembly factor BamE (lipoprotein component of BamABCDE complex)